MPAPVELIVFPDPEVLAMGALNTALVGLLPGVAASTKVPKPRPTEFIRVIRAGGPRETLISEQATIILEAYAATEARAAYILSLARAVMNAQDGTIFGVTEIGGPANLPDPDRGERYTMTLGIRVYGTALL